MRFNEDSFTHQYEKRLSREGYPGNLLNIVLDEVEGYETIIDVGAGTGFFSIPLARNGHNVIAIEPSHKMAKLFKDKMDKEISSLIRMYITDWETWQGERADGLVCIHSIYGMSDLKISIEKMAYHSDKKVLIIKADSGTISLSEIISQKLKKKRYTSDFSNRIQSVLHKIGLDYSLMEIEQRRESTFTRLDKEAEYYCYHLGLDSENLDIVKSLIEENSERINDKYIFRGLYRDILFLF